MSSELGVTKALREEFIGKTPITKIKKLQVDEYSGLTPLISFSTKRIPVLRNGELIYLGPYEGELLGEYYGESDCEGWLEVHTDNCAPNGAVHPHDDDLEGRICVGNNYEMLDKLIREKDWIQAMHLVLMHLCMPTERTESTSLCGWGATIPMKSVEDRVSCILNLWDGGFVTAEAEKFVGCNVRPGIHIERKMLEPKQALCHPSFQGKPRIIVSRNTRTKSGKIDIFHETENRILLSEEYSKKGARWVVTKGAR